MEPRYATEADDEKLRRLSREVPMVGSLSYCLEREPSFFDFSRLQGDEVYTAVLDSPDRARIEAMGTAVISDRGLAGQKRRVLYVADLKVALKQQRKGFIKRFQENLDVLLKERGVDYAYGLVLGGNSAVEALAASVSPRLVVQKRGTIRSHSFFLGGFRAARSADSRLRRATPEDLGEMTALWQRVQAKRDLAPHVADEQAFRARLGKPGGVRIEDFYVIYRGGRLVAFTAVWDPVGVRQVRVKSVSGSIAFMRALYNPVARVIGRPSLPADGELLRSLYLSHLCAEDPADLRLLVDQAHHDHRQTGQVFLEVALDVRDPLTPAVIGGFATRVDYTVYGLGWAHSAPVPCHQPIYADLGLA